MIPARIDNTPPANTSVTMSSNATHDAFDVDTFFHLISTANSAPTNIGVVTLDKLTPTRMQLVV